MKDEKGFWFVFLSFCYCVKTIRHIYREARQPFFQTKGFYKLQQTVLALNQINAPDCGDNGEARVGWCLSAF